MSKEILISARNISIGYSKSVSNTKVLHKKLSLELYAGELTCLLGVNGAGKSTLLRTLSNMQQPLDGSVCYRGKDIRGFSTSELSQMIGLVLTDKTMIGGFTVSQLVELGRYPYTGFFGSLSAKDKAVVKEAMQSTGILEKADSYVAELSDGERQKAMIAKSLAQECPVVMLDEPTAFLDIVSRIEIVNLLRTIAVTQNKAILLTTHDIELALSLSDRLWLLSKEKGFVSGTTEDVLLSGAIESFLSRDNLEFDETSGTFVPHRKYTTLVFVEAKNDTLYHWTKNFLNRNGFEITAQLSDATFVLKISERNEMEVLKNNKSQFLNSFDELKNWLTENYS
ncbi:MAG: ABC transporter ATP-binding protein [Dysgonomonas sp.]